MANIKSAYSRKPLSIIRSSFRLYYVKAQKNPLWLLMFIIGRFQIIRSLIIYFDKRSISNNYKLSYLTNFPELHVPEVVEALKKDGIYLGLNLPKAIVQEIIKFVNSTNCYGDGKDNYGFLYSEKSSAEQLYGKIFIRSEYNNIAWLCPAIQQLVNDHKLLEIATKYLGKNAIFTGCRLHWIFVVKEVEYDLDKAAMNFHYDLNDYRSLTFFFYLTDVDLFSGPHVCIRGSHNHKKLSYLLSLFRRQSEAELLNYYGEENKLTICGKSGFGFVEDVFCFHKATPPMSQDRLLLQIRFGLYDYNV